jgi:putative oxygen-independent coproporphyrinogen III oxidase
VPSTPPDGDPAPDDGRLPGPALTEVGAQPFGVYVHVPFCRVRCGYCDFNTYTSSELGGGGAQASYAETAIAEIELAARVLAESGTVPRAETVFFGGGTPTLLAAGDLAAILAAIAAHFGLAPDAEVTTEANPDSVTEWSLADLRAAGFTRISYGMQSAMGHVLRVLDRTHDPLRVPAAVEWARAAGFDEVSLDLIYGTPGETIGDWRETLLSALSCVPDHVSAYALIVEQGTALARQVRRGEIAAPDDDDMADKYALADELLGGAGLDWYELSNWARRPASKCRHNELYWTGAHWWGIGPGAHSHVGGVRWWNVRHPTAYASRLDAGLSPALAREVLDEETRRVERVLLESRLVSGLSYDVLDDAGRAAVPALLDDGLLEVESDRLVLTLRGRLLADAVVRALLP